jgi:hypothetical protein
MKPIKSKRWSPTGSREHLLQIARDVRTNAGPRIARMIERLAEEAEAPGASGVSAAKAVVSFALSATQLEAELEGELETSSGSATVNVLVALPGGESRAPDQNELRLALAAMSESVRAESKPS